MNTLKVELDVRKVIQLAEDNIRTIVILFGRDGSYTESCSLTNYEVAGQGLFQLVDNYLQSIFQLFYGYMIKINTAEWRNLLM